MLVEIVCGYHITTNIDSSDLSFELALGFGRFRFCRSKCFCNILEKCRLLYSFGFHLLELQFRLSMGCGKQIQIDQQQ